MPPKSATRNAALFSSWLRALFVREFPPRSFPRRFPRLQNVGCAIDASPPPPSGDVHGRSLRHTARPHYASVYHSLGRGLLLLPLMCCGCSEGPQQGVGLIYSEAVIDNNKGRFRRKNPVSSVLPFFLFITCAVLWGLVAKQLRLLHS